jgi:heme/copper-type cytochrome/quinol oxidase subunit 2
MAVVAVKEAMAVVEMMVVMVVAVVVVLVVVVVMVWGCWWRASGDGQRVRASEAFPPLPDHFKSKK